MPVTMEELIADVLANPTTPGNEGWQPMATAPNDNTLVDLLVDYEFIVEQEGSCPLEDTDIFVTAGQQMENEWHVIGWSWHQDVFVTEPRKPRLLLWRERPSVPRVFLAATGSAS